MNEFLQGAWDVTLALVPPVFVGGIFYVVMRAILRADRTERKVYAQIEAEETAKFEAAKAAKGADQASASKN